MAGMQNSPAAIKYFYSETGRRGLGDGITLFDGGTLTDDGYRVLQMGTDIAVERGAKNTTIADFKAAFADYDAMQAQEAANAAAAQAQREQEQAADDEQTRLNAAVNIVDQVSASGHPDTYGASIKALRETGVLVAGMDGRALYDAAAEIVLAKRMEERAAQAAPAPQPEVVRNEQMVLDFFSPGAAFSRSELFQLTQLQAARLTRILDSLVVRGLLAELTPDDAAAHPTTWDVRYALPVQAQEEQQHTAQPLPPELEGKAPITTSAQITDAATYKAHGLYVEQAIANLLFSSNDPISTECITRRIKTDDSPLRIKAAFERLTRNGHIRQVADGYCAVRVRRTEEDSMAATVTDITEATGKGKGGKVLTGGSAAKFTPEQVEGMRNLAQAVSNLDPSDGDVPEWMAKEIVALDTDGRKYVRAAISAVEGSDPAENGARFQITGLLTPQDVAGSKAARGSRGVKPPVAVKPPKAAREPKAPKPAPPPFDGVAQPTQDCIRVVNAYARAHSLSTEAKDAIIQDAVSRAQGDRRATHEHALLSVDALSDKNKVARIDRTQFLNPAEKAAWAALQGGAAWDSLDKRGRAGAQYFGLCDENGVIAK